MQHAIAEQAERARIAESLGSLPHVDAQKLFSDYIEERFDVHLHTFFGRLYDGVMNLLRSSIAARMDLLEESMADLKRSVLMASLHPYSWVESEVVRATCEYLTMQPGYRAGLHHIYRRLAFEDRLPLPGATMVDKYHYILRVLRSTERIREIEGFLFELLDYRVIEERESLASADGHREAAALAALVNELEMAGDQ